MAFKIVVLLATLAYANGGYIGAPVATYAAGPVATYAAAPVATYATAPVAVHDPHYGSTSQSVVRSLGGGQAVSHYSKAVDSAFSSVRKYDTRITNDAVSYAHAPVATYAAGPYVAKTTYAAPIATYAKAAYAAPVAAYAATPVATYAHAPVVAKAYGAPVATYAHAPVVAKAAVAYSPAAVVSHVTYDAPTLHYGW